jgi:glycosyltransferase involved in cell wall biosynthesis
MVTATLAVSEMQKELLVTRGVPKEKVEVIYNGVPSKENLVDRSGAKHVEAVFVGVLREDKRVDLLLQALAQIADRAPNLRLSVIGAGHAEHLLRTLARSLGVEDRIAWEGWQLDSGQYLERASFLVLPSDPGVETLSMAVLEAMAAGLPVICTDVGSMREVVDSTVGSLIPPGDAEALAKAMLEMYDSEALRAQKGLAAAARQRDKFSSDRLVGQMQHIILAKANRSTRR